ncbi:MAG: stage III sporulation protein AE [Eubacterium sp.]|nr:stage III sporulation protein AE [Eubacterium sp.]
MKNWRLRTSILVLLWMLMSGSVVSQAAVQGGAGQKKEGGDNPGSYDVTDWQDSIPLDEVEKVFQKMQGEGSSFSIRDYVDDIMEGKASFSLGELWNTGLQYIADQFNGQKDVLFRILALGIIAGIFVNFSGTIGDRNLGETGFYITYLLLFAMMAAGFHMAYQVAADSIRNLLSFMRALVPAFSLSILMGTGSGTSAAYYETMLIVISLIETLMVNILLPGVQIYFLLSMMNQLADNHFSRLTELVRSFLRWTQRILFGILVGYQGIQGILMPVLDKVKNNTVLQTAKGLPGVGNTVGSVADTVVGTGILIKSAIGVGGLICILVLCFYPLVKLLIFTVMYKIGGAVVQPVSDRRVAAALHAAAESGKILAGYVFAGALMFLLSIIIILICTNML